MTEKQHRIRPGDFTRSDSSPFQAHYEARVMQPLAECLKSEALFLDVRQGLMPGDSVTLCRYDKMSNNHKDIRLLEVANVRIVEVGTRHVDYWVDGDINVLEDTRPKAEPKPEDKPAAPSKRVKGTKKAA